MEGVKAEVGSLESSGTSTKINLHQRENRFISNPFLEIKDKVEDTYITSSSNIFIQAATPSSWDEYRAKKDALQTAIRVSELLVETVNGQVEATFINEKRIELEIRALVSTIMRYKKQTDQWLAASHALNTVIKEIGDFENWMKIMDFDSKTINAAIRNIHKI